MTYICRGDSSSSDSCWRRCKRACWCRSCRRCLGMCDDIDLLKEEVREYIRNAQLVCSLNTSSCRVWTATIVRSTIQCIIATRISRILNDELDQCVGVGVTSARRLYRESSLGWVIWRNADSLIECRQRAHVTVTILVDDSRIRWRLTNGESNQRDHSEDP